MKLVIEFNTTNSAFDEGNWEGEVIRIVDSATMRFKMGFDECKLRDSNGNVVGKLKVTFNTKEKNYE